MLRARAGIAATILRLEEDNPLGVFLVVHVPFGSSHAVSPSCCASMLQMNSRAVLGHTTPFLYGRICFGVLHLLLASIATFDTPPGSNPP